MTVSCAVVKAINSISDCIIRSKIQHAYGRSERSFNNRSNCLRPLNNDLIDQLVCFGRTAELLPPLVQSANRGQKLFLDAHQQGKKIASNLTQSNLEMLIKGVVLYQRFGGPACNSGSTTAVAPLFREYARLYPESEAHLCEWVLEFSVNIYEPFGSSIDFGARSQKERDKRSREYNLRRDEKLKRDLKLALELRAKRAQPKLPNAIIRGDVLAVRALLDAGAVLPDEKTVTALLEQLPNSKGRQATISLIDAERQSITRE